MTGCRIRKPRAPDNRLDHMRLNLDRDRRRRPCRKLRIERRGDAIRPLRSRCRSGIEESEISRMRDMDDTVFHLRDRPRQQCVNAAGRQEVECGKRVAKFDKVQCRRDGASGNALMRGRQFAGQDVVPVPPVFAIQEKR